MFMLCFFWACTNTHIPIPLGVACVPRPPRPLASPSQPFLQLPSSVVPPLPGDASPPVLQGSDLKSKVSAGQTLHQTTEGSVLSSKCWLFLYKFLIWPPSGSVLTGGIHNELSLIQDSSDCNLPNLMADDISQHQWMSMHTYFEGFVWNQPPYHNTAILYSFSFWTKQGCHSSCSDWLKRLGCAIAILHIFSFWGKQGCHSLGVSFMEY